VIRTDLNASLEELEWTVNAYTLTFAVLLLPGAALGDRFGRRRMFAAGLTLFTAAAAALAPNMDALIIARAIQGVGGAIVTPLTLTILSEAFTKERRGLALGACSGIAGLAVAARFGSSLSSNPSSRSRPRSSNVPGRPTGRPRAASPARSPR
jgi:MFS family permease